MTTNPLERSLMRTTTLRLARLLVPLTAVLGILAAGGGAGAATGNEHFTLSSTTVEGVDHAVRVVAVGAVHATGTFSAKENNGSSRDLITLHFAKGTITLAGHELKTSMVPNLRACTAKGTGRGTFTITGGTGAYTGITGRGTYLRHTSIVGARDKNGTCLGQKAQPKLVRYKATAVGTFNIG
jgi:hypothetical protein